MNHTLPNSLHAAPRAGRMQWRAGKLFCLLAVLLCVSAARAQWTQVWGGDFTGPAGTTYDHTKWWNNVQPTAVWGDGTIQNTSDSLQNAYLDGNGDLVIAMTYNPNASVQYTSARLTSTYAAGPYGRMDTRIQNPSAVGMGAAFWALGANAYPAGTGPGSASPSTNGGVPWPWCGELDMMELQAQTNQHNGSTVHGGETDSQTSYEYGGLSAAVNLTGTATFDNGFHIFSTEWAPYSITYLLDGVQYATVNIADIGATDQWEMNQPINFILSSGVGGNGGTPTGIGFPSNMVINYVNYSQWSAGAPSPVTNLTATALYSNAVNLSWNASATSDVTYDIYASTVAGTAPSLATLVAQNISTTTYQHTGLTPNTTYYYTVVSANYGGESSASNATVTTQAPGNSTGMQISAGGYAVGTYMNSNFVLGGNTNYHYSVGPPAGLTAVDTSEVTNPAPQQVYNTERWGAAAWTITGLNPGAGYNVRLHFVEFAHTAAGQRNFNVSINSQQVLTNFDIFAAAGAAETAIVEQFYTKADENGIIEIETSPGTTSVVDLNPTINALEIVPSTGSNPVGAAPGTTTDLAINSGGPAVGNFLADEDFNGGDTATSTNTISTAGVANAAPEAVYQTQRYVPFTYVLNGLVADAAYTLNMHFSETYWTAAGDRIFNVVVNGKPALTNFDIYATAGANQAVVKQFTTNADMYGQIIVQLIYAGADQPMINGIEAIESGAAIGAPSNLTATPSGSSIALSWAASSTSGVTYTLYRTASGGATTALSTGSAALTYTDSTVTSGASYSYYVVANSGGSTSPESNTVTVTAGGSTGCSVIPSIPGIPSGTSSSSTQVALTWGASTASGCSVSYSVFRSTTSGFTPSSSNQVGTNLGTNSFADTGLTASTTYYYVVKATDSDGTSAASTQTSVTTQSSGCTGTCADVVAINSGGPAVSGFAADEDVTGGGTDTSTATISTTGVANAAPEAIYQSEHAGVFTYTIPGLTAGSSYSVRLHFAEYYWTRVGQRIFNVAINGTAVLSNFDIIATAGGADKALMEQFTATANSSGQIVIAFTAGSADQPKVSGIEILGASAPPATANINSGGPATGSFAADEDFSGGGTDTSTATISTTGVANAAPEAVYQSERAGVFTYTIPGLTVGSTHTVLLHFAEYYWTTTGQRIFNVAINGTPVLKNFDIIATAGGADKALVESFTAIANSSGQIVISFTAGSADQPKLSGLQIE